MSGESFFGIGGGGCDGRGGGSQNDEDEETVEQNDAEDVKADDVDVEVTNGDISLPRRRTSSGAKSTLRRFLIVKCVFIGSRFNASTTTLKVIERSR